MVSSLIAELDQTVFRSGVLAATFYEDPSLPRFTKELTAVLSLTHCSQAKDLDKKASERNVVHLSITDSGCSRLSSASSLSVPLVTIENSVVQTLKDLRDGHTLTWESFIILYDDSISETTLNSLQKVLSDDAAIATFSLSNATSVSSILSSLPGRKLGNKFMVITKKASVASIHKSVEAAGLMNINTEWLYLVTDTNRNSEMSQPTEIKEAKDGYNLAFLYNASNPNGLNCQVSS